MFEEKKEEEKKKGLDIKDWVQLVGVMVAILVAGTTLLNLSGKVPFWWFEFSLIFLIVLVFSTPVVIFWKSVSKRLDKLSERRRQNAIAQKYFLEFKNLVETAKRFNSSIKGVLSGLVFQYVKDRGLDLFMLRDSYNETDIQNLFSYLEKEIDESNRTYHDLYLMMKQFDLILWIYKKYLSIMEIFAHETMTLENKPIAKDVEAPFEKFREQYNYFVKDFSGYCKKLNQELGKTEFPEYALNHLEKW